MRRTWRTQTVQHREAMAASLRAMGLLVAPSATNFLFVNLGQPNGPVNEALLKRGVIVKPWKKAGLETFLRVSISTAQDNALFLDALRDGLATPGR